MPFAVVNSTVQTGPAYKAQLDANSQAMAGISGKRRNVNGDGRVNQLVTGVAMSAAFQYFLDMWEGKTTNAGTSSGTLTQVTNTNFPAGVSIGMTASLTTTGAVTISYRTKIESKNVKDMLSAPFITGAHAYASLGLIAFQDTGSTITVTPIIRSADAVDNFTTMTNSLTGAAQNLTSGSVTQFWWDTVTSAFTLDTLTNVKNGLCLELQFAIPSGVTSKSLQVGDIQLEGGAVAGFFGRLDFWDEFLHCQRYYSKTFALATAPAQNAGTGSSLVFTQAVAAATAQKGNLWEYPTRMRAAPTITFFNPSAANAQVRNLDSATDCSATATDIIGEWATSFNTTSPAATSAGQRLAVHMTADARL